MYIYIYVCMYIARSSLAFRQTEHSSIMDSLEKLVRDMILTYS